MNAVTDLACAETEHHLFDPGCLSPGPRCGPRTPCLLIDPFGTPRVLYKCANAAACLVSRCCVAVTRGARAFFSFRAQALAALAVSIGN